MSNLNNNDLNENPKKDQPHHAENGSNLGDHHDDGIREDSRFKDGQIIKLVRVRFPGNARSFTFLTGKNDWRHGDKVVALSDRGMAVGYINSFPYEIAFDKTLLPLRTIARMATKDDLEEDKNTFKQEKRYGEVCQKYIDKHELDMQLTHVETTQYGKKAVFYFIAPSRIDFRNLVHDLVSELKMRIELRQISVRDRAAAVGGLGPCGRELCCSSFLSKYGNVGIKLAKNQDLSLNSSKINGVCGQLKCCLTYEDEVYLEKRKKLPKENSLIKTKDGTRGKVTMLHVIIEQFDLLSTQGVVKRYDASMWLQDNEPFEFPKVFEQGISLETSQVVGLKEKEQAAKVELQNVLKTLPALAKTYADNMFKDLFGETTLDWALPSLKEENPTINTYKNPEEEDELIYFSKEEEDEDPMGDEVDVEVDDPAPSPVKNHSPVYRPNKKENAAHQSSEKKSWNNKPR